MQDQNKSNEEVDINLYSDKPIAEKLQCMYTVYVAMQYKNQTNSFLNILYMFLLKIDNFGFARYFPLKKHCDET